MPYAEGARYQSARGCLQGTREEMIDKICQWVKSDDDDVPRMLLLSGVAGSGKSAIAHTVAHRFDQVGRLGSSFFFDRSHQAVRRPDNIFSTIARDLAELDPRERECLSRVIQGKKSLRTTSAPREQFEQFILKPALELTFVGPIVIVIDGLDESADPASRSDLLSVLADKVPKLPPNFRVLVTTRAEQDIHEALAKNSDVVCEYMDAISRESSDRDIASFIRTQLRDVPSLQRKWPNDAWCQLLVEKSEGLFQWAFTACHFIRGKGKGGLNPAERLSMLVTSTFKNNQSDHMDQLYLRILSQIFDAEDNVVMERFRSVLGNVLIIKDSLSISALKSLCYTDESADIVDLILQPLGSLLSGITQDFPVRPLHTSFRDFLTSPSRGGSFFIDISLHHNSLSRACLRVMKTELRFNICGLETSCVLNREIPDLAARVKNAIPTHLSYACRFWANHLHATPFDGVILKEVKNFMHIHLLFWLEVLSLTKQVNTAPTGLSSVIKWSRVSTRIQRCNSPNTKTIHTHGFRRMMTISRCS
jgi:AAA ATPase domain